MGKLGFMQDLIRGIKKLTAVEKEPVVKETVVVKSEGGNNLIALLKRGNMALEDSKWEDAEEYFDRVLDIDAECAEAYWGKTLAQQRCRDTEGFIRKRKAPLDSLKPETLSAGKPDTPVVDAAVARFTECGYLEEKNIRSVYGYSSSYPSLVSACAAVRVNEGCYWSGDKNLSKAMRFSSGTDNKLAQTKQAILSAFDERIAAEKQKDADAAKSLLEAYPAHLRQAEERCIREYALQHTKRFDNALSAEQKADTLFEKANAGGQEKLYVPATAAYESARALYQKLVPGADISAHIDRCTVQLEQIDAAVTRLREAEAKKQAELVAAEAKRQVELAAAEAIRKAAAAKKTKKVAIISLSGIAVAIVLLILIVKGFIPAGHYSAAEKELAAGNYAGADEAFSQAGSYKDAAERIGEGHYLQAETLLAAEDYAGADEAFTSAGSYKDAAERIGEGYYLHGEALLAEKNYAGAIIQFESAGTYSDAHARTMETFGLVTERLTLAAWGNHTVGLCADGTVVAVGYNEYGQCDVSDWKDIVAIAAGESHTVGLYADGTVVAVGSKASGQCDVSDWTDIVEISAGKYHTVGLRADGTVVAVGSNKYDKCNVSGWTDIVAIAAGCYHTVGLRADGTAVAVGHNGVGPCDVSGWTDIVAIAVGCYHTVGLRADGTAVAVGDNGAVQCDVSGWTDIVAIAAGYAHTVGLRSDGTVLAVGYNVDGQCNVSGWTDIKLPAKK